MLLLLFYLFAVTGYAQELTIPVKLLSNVKTGPELYEGTDAFGNIYTIKDNEFRKETGGVMLKYKNLSFGEIFSTDLQSPLQIVLFYKKFNIVVLLDNQLNETMRIDFSNIPQQPLIAEAIGLASQNRLWVYDINTMQAGLYDLSQKTFKTITPPFTDTIVYYQSDYNYFYWIDTKGKCFVLNLFGSVTFLGTIPAYDQVTIVSEALAIYKKGDAIYTYNFKTGAQNRIETGQKSFKSFYYAADILSIFTDTEIFKYKIILPQ